MNEMFHGYLYILFSCSIMLLKHVEAPLLETLTPFKGFSGDPCADEDQGEETWRNLQFTHEHSRGIHLIRHPPRGQRIYTFEEVHAAANKFFRLAEYDRALRCYHKAVKKNVREYAKVFRNRGLCATRLNLHAEAIADYQRSLEIEPRSVRGRYFLGRQYSEENRFDESLRLLKEALELGEEQNMIHEEKMQVKFLIDRVLHKKRQVDLENERIRREHLLAFLKELVRKDAKNKIYGIKQDRRGDANEKIKKISKNRDEYLEELDFAFKEDKDLQPASLHEVPKYLCDSISLGIMRDPVTTPNGVSYENLQLRRHFEQAGDWRDPISRVKLRIDQLRPNKALKDYIDDYMQTNRLFYDDA